MKNMFKTQQYYENTMLSPFEILDHGQLPIDQRIYRPKTVPKKRPGKLPAKADSDLSGAELNARNRRRDRNKRAAQRGRNRIANKIASLESEVSILGTEHTELKNNVDFYRHEIHRLRRAIFSAESGACRIHTETRRVSNTDEYEHYTQTDDFFVQPLKTEIPTSDLNQLLHQIH